MFQRQLNLHNLLKNKSFFLFGPRATGKSFLIRHEFRDSAIVFDLLRSDLYLQLSAQPHQLESMIDAASNFEYVVVDEVQRVPMLLNEVHRLIETRNIKFLLTGSSARSLRQQHVNLLAGRAWEANLFPLVSTEIPDFDLMRYLQFGGLPAVYSSEKPAEELHAYVDTYLKEEIQAESLVRKIPSFARFLKLAALTSGNILNFSSVANDAGIPISTVREYYHILEDTFIGFLVPAWTKTMKRKAMSTAKFYLFDCGVKHTLSGVQSLEKTSDVYGRAFEHFIALELRAYLSYRRLRSPLSYWQSQQHQEVDFIVGDDIAIEVKSADKIHDKHLKGIRLLKQENICKKYMVISHDLIHRKEEGIDIIHWKYFLEKLWNDDLL
ncbi:MAG: ATPase [Gammaproteobacteria bacterium RIFCSPLOWO2_02_FULL_42_14]|nr:MAG: ATPase [Gammaproteobacteria bacterium RIFCSPHIGHO2_02_FULL_42_43]OGT28540.1 MAG: ATPase [Gammaproteobacteria bacterium RIFCSPHIGHO2_01_FULL_42_8]OGT51445.1 MAG: ATPase [Gammaproteobacteria bacterium RIFCSPHIGHO2_12_FULL_41_25]OGT62147.1 MAG: ATPase [Gammaproteobacteria bacterium RIFCSPLOWO2_02_FULL_42_14]OGT85819.1 MAG: ATPase [Gammaproteobacteria bacterium RIFCSPLOWO2_12_FULL_42_18]